jgi:hypothetical protein
VQARSLACALALEVVAGALATLATLRFVAREPAPADRGQNALE